MDGAVEKDSGPESLSSSESDELEEEDGVGRVATGITGRAAEFVVAGSLAGGAVAVGGRGIAADAGDGEVAGLTSTISFAKSSTDEQSDSGISGKPRSSKSTSVAPTKPLTEFAKS